MTTGGITCGKLLIEFLGIGIGSGLLRNPTWENAFDENGVGTLIVESYAPLDDFGKFCTVVLALCIATNNIPGTYAASLNFQQLGNPLAKVPRVIWSTFACIVFTVIAIAGRDNLFPIFINFLGIIGYWTIIWITMTFEDELTVALIGRFGTGGIFCLSFILHSSLSWLDGQELFWVCIRPGLLDQLEGLLVLAPTWDYLSHLAGQRLYTLQLDG